MTRELLERGRTEAILLLIFLFLSTSHIDSQQKSEIAPLSRSDSFATDGSGRKFRVQHRELAKENFKIAGVDLASEEDVLKLADQVLGPVKTYTTGDASTGDTRSCYRPTANSDSTRLYFHEGEVDSWFVLSSGTPPTERNDPCRSSSKVTRNIATESGLKLGQSQEAVIAILGLPTRRNHNSKTNRDFMAYEYETRIKASAGDLARARLANPAMSEQDLLSNYGFYDLSESIRMKFTDNLLTELQVDWSATD